MPIDINQSPPFITPWTIFLITLILVIGAIIILTIIERKLNKKVSQKNSDNYSTNSQNSLMDNSEKRIPINKIVHNITEEKISIKDTTPEIKIIKTEELLVLTPEEE